MSHYRPEDVARYFDQLGMGEWERLVSDPVQEIKLAIHSHYLRQHLEAGDRVLEIGAGAGRFTQVLAEIGCRVLVGDISALQLELNRRLAREHAFADAVEAWQELDVCDLGGLPSGSFDAVVSYGGPLSYVFDAAGRALDECRRVLRPDGTLLCSVMALWGSLHAFLPKGLAFGPEVNRSIISNGDITPEQVGADGHHCHSSARAGTSPRCVRTRPGGVS